jgi:hypothetical protein
MDAISLTVETISLNNAVIHGNVRGSSISLEVQLQI